MVPRHGVTEAHPFVASLVHLGCTMRVSSGWARGGRLGHNTQGKQGESDHAGATLVHDDRATDLPRDVKQQRLQSHDYNRDDEDTP